MKFGPQGTVNRLQRQLLYCLSFVALFSGIGEAVAAKIKCWKNDEGVRECGTVVPPEYSQKRIEILNERGIVIDVKEAAKTKEQLAKEARLAKLKQEQQRREEEQRRLDRILLQTYTTEKDLRLSHEDKVTAIKSIIDITNSNTRSLQKNLAQIQKQAANYERGGQTPPKSLTDDMDSLLRQIQDNEEFIKKKSEALGAINKKFDADLKRFRKLKRIR